MAPSEGPSDADAVTRNTPPDAPGSPQPDGPDWSSRAALAAESVIRNFGRRFLFLPATHIAAVAHSPRDSPTAQGPHAASLRKIAASRSLRRLRSVPAFNNLVGPWHFWWQAQYLDCLVDARRRQLAERVPAPDGPNFAGLASRLLRTVRLRNGFRYTNDFYDDMAWLGLAAVRLGTMAPAATGLRRRADRIRDILTPEFEAAADDVLGGGVYWSRQRDFKNTPATGPVALFFARTGQRDRAQLLVDWLGSRLLDDERGLYLDGLRIRGSEVILEPGLYTYNQGPVLGALLELGGEANVARAAELVAAVERRLCPTPESAALRCDGRGDGGLFTGILVRYLALAARDAALPASARDSARRMVTSTAETLWAGRSERSGQQAGWLVFPVHPTVPADVAYPAGATVELSTQLQAWMTLEAAATLT